MILTIFLNSVCLIISLIIGFYVLFLSSRDKTHQLFFLIALSIAFMNSLLIIFQAFKDINIMWLIYKIDTSISFIFYNLLLLFIIYLSRAFKLIKLFYFLLLLCLISIIMTMRAQPYIKFIWFNNSWRIYGAVYTFEFIINIIYSVFYLLLYLTIFLYYIFKTKLKREKRQYIVLLLTIFTGIFIVFFIVILRNFFTFYSIIAPMPFTLTIFLLGCWYIIVKYRFLVLTPELVSKDILENINDSIVLITHDKKIITANAKTKALLNIQKIDGKELSSIIFDYQRINQEIERLISKNLVDFSCRFYYINIENQNILMDARFSIVKDKFDDVLGILLIAKEVKEIKQLKTIYKITEREAEIIENIIMGYSNLEISGKIY